MIILFDVNLLWLKFNIYNYKNFIDSDNILQNIFNPLSSILLYDALKSKILVLKIYVKYSAEAGGKSLLEIFK